MAGIYGLVVRRWEVDPATRTMEHKKELDHFTDFMGGFNLELTVGIPMKLKLSRLNDTVLAIDLLPAKEYFVRLDKAYAELVEILFGSSEVDAREFTVIRSRYQKVLHDVQRKYGLEEGDPDMGEWVMMLVMRSPKFAKEAESLGGRE